MAKASDRIVSGGGYGESKVFGGRAPSPTDKMLNAHIDGVRIADMDSAQRDTILATIPWSGTDEGKAEHDAQRAAAGAILVPPGTAARVTPRSPHAPSQRFSPEYSNPETIPQQFRDLSTELGPVENPLDVLRQPHQNAEPEMRFFWASKRQIDNGRHLDKEAVTAANGDPVRYRNMVLMKYPQQAAEAKMARNKARSERLLNSIASDHIREVQKRLGPTMSAPEMNAFVTAMERETQTQGAQLNG